MQNEFADYPGVVVQPGRVGGKPTLGESRVPAELVAESLDHGEKPEEIAYNYSLPLEAVLDFKTYKDAHQPALKP
ncbi:MAG: DUF433 domain-containing protein [Bryobacteraceae bacterium]